MAKQKKAAPKKGDPKKAAKKPLPPKPHLVCKEGEQLVWNGTDWVCAAIGGS